MQPIPFKEMNMVFAKDQPEYDSLPGYRDHDGMVISCWAASWRERVRFFLFGKVWVSILTFNSPLQPIRLQVEYPFEFVESVND
jgi:hypothetical protein